MLIHYIESRPKLMGSLTFGGTVLILLSVALLLTSHVSFVQAETCSSHPIVGSGNTYATDWKVNKWLALDGVPIGPSSWQVLGRFKNASTETCFSESWTLKKVVMASSRIANRGQIINAVSGSVTIPELDKGYLTGDRVLNFNVPVQQVQQSAKQCTGGTILGIGATCTTIQFPQDPAYAASGGNSPWDPVGMYGALRDSSTDLKFSRSFYPLEWQVDGRF